MTFKHAVTVFQPSDRLRSLAQQRRDQSFEYKERYNVENDDPSSWQPLDPMCTFNHYSALHGFGPKAAQRLRICEGTEDYKLRNHRYRAFEEQRVLNSKRLEDVNEEKRCYGYGVYKHKNDGDSLEWRPIMADRPESRGQDSRTFKARWLYTPSFGTMSAAEAAAGLGDPADTLEEVDVLLAAHNPKVLGSGHFEHQEFLAEAVELQKSGKNAQEIARVLNTKLERKFQATQEQPDSEPEDGAKADPAKQDNKKKAIEAPPPITVQEVIHHLAVMKGEEGASQSGAASGRSTPRGGSEAGLSRTDDLASTSQPEARPDASFMGGMSGMFGGSGGTGPSSSGPSTMGPSSTGPRSGGPMQSGGPPSTGPSFGPSGPSRTSGPSIGNRPAGGGGGPQRG